MPLAGSCKCAHCKELFQPDARNAGRQRYCPKAACRRASKARSQRAWLAKPENRGYFRDAGNRERVRAWRAEHPGYWRRGRAGEGVALQETRRTQPTDHQREGPVQGPALQETLISQTIAMEEDKSSPAAVFRASARVIPLDSTALQDLLVSQDALITGLIVSFSGVALQEDIVAMKRRLMDRGRAVMG